MKKGVREYFNPALQKSLVHLRRRSCLSLAFSRLADSSGPNVSLGYVSLGIKNKKETTPAERKKNAEETKFASVVRLPVQFYFRPYLARIPWHSLSVAYICPCYIAQPPKLGIFLRPFDPNLPFRTIFLPFLSSLENK